MTALEDHVDFLSPEVDPTPKAPVASAWCPTASQRTGLERLHSLADIFESVGDDPVAGYRPMVRSLVIGPSGSGKSALARQFAEERDWKFLAVDCGSWLPQGAITKPATLRVVRDHIRSADRVVLYLDELCKLLPRGTDVTSSWSLGCWSEFLALDGDSRLINHEWTKHDIDKLKTRCFVIAGGAFTHALVEAKASQKRGQLGFQDKESPASGYADKIRESLPEEVYSRFHQTPILLESPSRDDLAQAIEKIHAQLHIPRTRPIKALLDEAQGSAGGMRWVQGYVTEILLANPGRLPARKDPAQEKPQPQSFDFITSDSTYYARQATEDSFKLRAVLVRIHAEMNARKAKISQKQNAAFQDYVYGPSGERLIAFAVAALKKANACAEVSADDSGIIDPILFWRREAWVGLTMFPAELSRFGLLSLFNESWDLATRVAELRGYISLGVAMGRYGSSS